jgi:hypothetical protein
MHHIHREKSVENYMDNIIFAETKDHGAEATALCRSADGHNKRENKTKSKPTSFTRDINMNPENKPKGKESTTNLGGSINPPAVGETGAKNDFEAQQMTNAANARFKAGDKSSFPERKA